MKIRSLILSIDFILSALVGIGLMILLPSMIEVAIAKEIFEVAIAVLSIVFAVYFAAMTVVISSGDDDFIHWLEEDGSYSHIIWTFKITLLLLFLALLLSIVLFAIVLPSRDEPLPGSFFPRWCMAPFAWLALWALFAAAQVTFDSIEYAQRRLRFIRLNRPGDKK